MLYQHYLKKKTQEFEILNVLFFSLHTPKHCLKTLDQQLLYMWYVFYSKTVLSVVDIVCLLAEFGLLSNVFGTVILILKTRSVTPNDH